MKTKFHFDKELELTVKNFWLLFQFVYMFYTHTWVHVCECVHFFDFSRFFSKFFICFLTISLLLLLTNFRSSFSRETSEATLKVFAIRLRENDRTNIKLSWNLFVCKLFRTMNLERSGK